MAMINEDGTVSLSSGLRASSALRAFVGWAYGEFHQEWVHKKLTSDTTIPPPDILALWDVLCTRVKTFVRLTDGEQQEEEHNPGLAFFKHHPLGGSYAAWAGHNEFLLLARVMEHITDQEQRALLLTKFLSGVLRDPDRDVVLL